MCRGVNAKFGTFGQILGKIMKLRSVLAKKLLKEIGLSKNGLGVPNTPINDICNKKAYIPYVRVSSSFPVL